MNITNIKNEVKNFLSSINANVVDISYVPGTVCNSYNEYTGEEFEEKTNDAINVTLGDVLLLNKEQNKKLAEFEAYLYMSYHNLIVNYELAH